MFWQLKGNRVCHPKIWLFGICIIFELITLKKLQTQEKLWKQSESYLLWGKSIFIKEIYIRNWDLYQEESCCQRSLLHLRDLLTWPGKLWQTFPLSPSRWITFPSLKPQTLSLSLAQDGIQASIVWLSFESHIFVGLPQVIKIVSFFLLLMCLLLQESLSQELRKVKNYFFSPTIDRFVSETFCKKHGRWKLHLENFRGQAKPFS